MGSQSECDPRRDPVRFNSFCHDNAGSAGCRDRDHIPAVLRQGRHPVRGPDAQLGGHAAGPGRLPGVDAVVRGRADDQHVPAVGDQAQESNGDAGLAAARAEGDRRQHAVLQQDVRAASQADHPADSIDGATRRQQQQQQQHPTLDNSTISTTNRLADLLYHRSLFRENGED